MPLKLLADENIDERIIRFLKKQHFKIISIEKEYRGMSDFEVLQLSKKHKAILLTEDSDFGEWIFSFKEQSLGVIKRIKSECGKY